MRKLILLAVFVCSSFSVFAQDNATTYFLIRHAEKVRSNKNDKDPNLSMRGAARATHWAKVLSNIKFDMIYTTDYKRTKQTIAPTAEANKTPVYLYNSNDMYNAAFVNNTKGKTILIAGHSNTIAVFANKILGVDKYKEIEDDNNSNLYIITVSNDSKSGVLLKIDM